MKRITALFALLLVACSSAPSQSVIQTAIAQTQVAAVTPTRTATAAPAATLTSTPTATATVTLTPTITDTPLPPQTLTAQALIDNKTATAASKSATATLIAAYVVIDRRELVTYPDKHFGETVKVCGSIFNIVDDSDLQMDICGTLDAVYVTMRAPFSALYENDRITVYGTIQGTKCFTNRLNAQICQPLLIDAFYTK